ncbi:glucose-1-phosphate thymidylyltransferase [Thermoplasma volcanium GSS1]|uniref:glucose-1-phosphate thymidylyltransferase n=1 Tax=Thermoplasma volcanium (strain ATCC 51530 / DSM 4299 / JCM 9571 / NBRC 15438 / GSS1) TaxID=273116 RepID=Q97BC7_THEVO|nr:sugar phosphate nucleotidyltransferase [Thermoplasma volcanium]BAB59671.1 glucose-1-phosphate thymidylyltransferase [Thermoplasma volcanium GSS1]
MELQGLITAAGLGTRSGASQFYRKEMFSIYDARDGKVVIRPIIDCVIYRMKISGIDDIIVVLDPKDEVTKKYIELSYPDVQIAYQTEKRGYGDAVHSALQFIHGPFLLNAGDGVLFDDNTEKRIVDSYKSGNRLIAFKVDDPRRYGVVEMDENGNIAGLEEKPNLPKSNLALAAIYILDKSVLNEIDTGKANVELTDAIDRTIKKGVKSDVIEIDRSEWISVGLADRYADVVSETRIKALRKIGKF